MSDGITDAEKQTREALEYVRRKAEKEMSEQQQKAYIITEKQVVSLEHSKSSWARGVASEVRSRPHTPAPTLYKMQTDDDGSVGKVAICLCEQCKVNGFLCLKSPRAISPHTAPATIRVKQCEHWYRGVGDSVIMCHKQYCESEAAKAAREQDIAKIQKKLNKSKKNLYGFDAKEAEWINGFEAGLDAAIDLLRTQQEPQQEEP